MARPFIELDRSRQIRTPVGPLCSRRPKRWHRDNDRPATGLGVLLHRMAFGLPLGC